MKLFLRFKFPNQLRIPVFYHREIQGLIYNLLPDGMANFLHNEGYKSGPRRYSMFSFSQLEGKCIYDSSTKTLTFPHEATLIISSIVPFFLEEIAKNTILNEKMSINNQKIQVIEVKFVEEKVESSSILVKARSPITVYTTYQRRSGKRFMHYFHPHDEAFQHLIEEGIFRKYEAFTRETVPRSKTFEISAHKLSRNNKIITKYKGTIINAWSGIYRIKSDPKFLEFALAVALGSKSSMGFGLITKESEE